MGVYIGKETMVSLGAKIDVRRGRVVIGDNCTITYGVVLLSHDAAQDRLGKHHRSQAETVIENGVFIGVNSVIMPGVRVGTNSIVGAGSIVIRDVPPNSLAVGNPAKIIKSGI